MAANEDRSELFNEIQNFSQRKLKKVETNCVTPFGEKVIEKRSAKGLQSAKNDKVVKSNLSVSKKDLQVGLVAPGLMIGKLNYYLFNLFTKWP